MSDKDILIFDEPASMLDPISELEQITHIKEKLAGNTAILISHRVGFARLADRIILLSDGKVAEVGTHDELMAKNGLYANFFNEQAQWYQKDAEETENG
jgi:ATP-binding cassette subfamily B protein